MLAEEGLGILFQLPFGDGAFFTAGVDPLVAQPAGRPAVFGVSNQEGPVAVGGYLGVVLPHLPEKFNSVQGARPGGPEFNLLDQSEKIYPLAVISLLSFAHKRPLEVYWRGVRESHPAT